MGEFNKAVLENKNLIIEEHFYNCLLYNDWEFYYKIGTDKVLLEFTTELKDFKYEHDQDGLSVYVGTITESCYEKIKQTSLESNYRSSSLVCLIKKKRNKYVREAFGRINNEIFSKCLN